MWSINNLIPWAGCDDKTKKQYFRFILSLISVTTVYEVFHLCSIKGAKRFCLTHELCPWRAQRSPACAALFELTTCSPAGLNSAAMATTWGVTSSCRRHCRGRWFWRRCSTKCSCSGSTYKTVQCHKGSVRAFWTHFLMIGFGRISDSSWDEINAE